jgi:hypothetical protein
MFAIATISSGFVSSAAKHYAATTSPTDESGHGVPDTAHTLVADWEQASAKAAKG